MVTVKFNETWDSRGYFGLHLVGREIGSPEVKRIQIDVPFADGVLDMTDYFGDVLYTNRIIQLDFLVEDWRKPAAAYTEFLQNTLLNAKKLSFSDDEGWTYNCVSMVATPLKKTHGKMYGFSVEVECEPYKYNASGERTL